MNIIASVTLVATLSQAPPVAQTFKPSANPVSDALRDFVTRYTKNLTRSAELMPAEKYGFHPTDPQMTFGQLMVHIVQTNMALCSAISGEAAPMTADELRKLTPAGLNPRLIAAARPGLRISLTQPRRLSF